MLSALAFYLEQVLGSFRLLPNPCTIAGDALEAFTAKERKR